MTQAMPGQAANAARIPSFGWILDSRRDLVLLIATPLLILPLIALARGRWTDETVYAFVMAFGSTGHHLPGLLRAYGDRELFARFRTRFILGPILLAGVCLLLTFADMRGLTFMLLIWGTWHGLAQVYGIGRIYDGKVGAFDPRMAQLDKAMCIAWFGLGVMYSESHNLALLEELYRSGFPALSPEAVSFTQGAWLAATLAVTLAWGTALARRRARGEAVSAAKVLLFVSSFGFWLWVLRSSPSVIVGVACFEIFHDVQYLTIVWVYNRSRLAKDPASLGGFSRLLFAAGSWRVLLFVAAVGVYGAFDMGGKLMLRGDLQRALVALVIASGFLHFYYDSFIWNLRDASTRRNLDVTPGQPLAEVRSRAPAWVAHAWNWGWFVVPLAAIAAAQLAGPSGSDLAWRQAIARTLPANPDAWLYVAQAHRRAGRPDEAIAALEEVVAMDPTHVNAHRQLAVVYQDQGDAEAFFGEIERLAALDPSSVSLQFRLGQGLQERGRLEESEAVYLHLLELDPDHVFTHANLGAVRIRRGDLAGARVHLERALELQPNLDAARRNLLLLEARERSEADGGRG
jgi:tetratricopeptide (TPR) repeat protein